MKSDTHNIYSAIFLYQRKTVIRKTWRICCFSDQVASILFKTHVPAKVMEQQKTNEVICLLSPPVNKFVFACSTLAYSAASPPFSLGSAVRRKARCET